MKLTKEKLLEKLKTCSEEDYVWIMNQIEEMENKEREEYEPIKDEAYSGESW
jgi:hypothetical protein